MSEHQFSVGSSLTNPTENPNELIRTSNLHRHFASPHARGQGQIIRAVDGVDLSVFEKETLGIVGETGSGKSTLGKMLVGLLPPTSGSVLFQGVDINSISRSQKRHARRGLQMIFQDPLSSLDPRWSARQVLEEPLKASGMRSRQLLQNRVVDLVSTVGLDKSILDRLPNEMSGGQRQRIGIARALALNPKVIVADEPVSALDVSVQAQIINLLSDLQDQFGISLVFIAHGLEVVRHLSDRIMVMYLGRAVEAADTDQLFSKSLHPYTDSLIGSIPKPDPKSRKSLKVISGEVGASNNLPQGCRFSPRCQYRRPKCDDEDPILSEVLPRHYVACHYPLYSENSSDIRTTNSEVVQTES